MHVDAIRSVMRFVFVLFAYLLAGGFAGFVVAAFAFWPGALSESFPFIPQDIELSLIYGTSIGLPLGALCGLFYGLGMGWILQPLRHAIIIPTLVGTVIFLGAVGGLESPVHAIRGTILGVLISTVFLLAMSRRKGGARDKHAQNGAQV